MRNPAELGRIRTVVEAAVFASVQGIRFPGIEGAELKSMTLFAKQLQHLVTQLAQNGFADIWISAQIELFLRPTTTC